MATFPSDGLSQEAVVRVEENFRAEPNGTILAELTPGTRLVVEGHQGGWTRVALEGFVSTPSLRARDGGVYDLVVSEPSGENIHETPSGLVAGRLITGALLQELTRIPGWVRVRRSGWIWTASVEFVEGTTAAGEPVIASLEPGPVVRREEFIRSGSGGATILAVPDGDSLGRIHPGSELRVLSREGNWGRVQLEGWVWLPSVESSGEDDDVDPAVLSVTRSEELTTDADRFGGRLVEMHLQFISLERAEQVRTDFYEGEPFLLTRSMGQDRRFIYVAVPPDRLVDAGTLMPLETILVVARVRSGAATFTGSPILDLVEFERVP